MVGQFFLPVCWTFARRRDGRDGQPTDVRGLIGALADLRGWGRAFKLQNWHGGWEVLVRLLTANFEIGTPDPCRFRCATCGPGKYRREGSKESNGGKEDTERADGV